MKSFNLKFNSVTAFAPASVGNVACGFDCMGFAIDGLGDHVTVSASSHHENDVVMSGDYGDLIPSLKTKNTASVAIQHYLNAFDLKLDLHIELQKNLPLGSGLGSSASSAAAAVFALNHLLGNPCSTKELIPFAMEGERVACGSAHADNVAPSLLGGFVLVRSNAPLDVVQLPCPSELFCAVVHPHCILKTSDSRKIISKELSLQNAITQSANTAALVAALYSKDFELLGRSIHDVIAEPKRSLLIPNYTKIRELVLQGGALNLNISGSGPSLFSICIGESKAYEIANIIKQGFFELGLESDVICSPFQSSGARILSAT